MHHSRETSSPTQPAEPRMRASYIKDNLKALSLLGVDVAERVRARVPKRVAQIDGAARVDWLPLDVDIELTAAVAAEVGDGGVRRWGRQVLLDAVAGPLLGPLVKGTLHVLGVTPRALFKIGPRVWDSIYQHCGVVRTVELGNDSAVLAIDGAPSTMCDAGYLEGIAGAVEAFFVLAHTEGRVTLTSPSPARIDLVAEWAAR